MCTVMSLRANGKKPKSSMFIRTAEQLNAKGRFSCKLKLYCQLLGTQQLVFFKMILYL